jgi:hypothetical protein
MNVIAATVLQLRLYGSQERCNLPPRREKSTGPDLNRKNQLSALDLMEFLVSVPAGSGRGETGHRNGILSCCTNCVYERLNASMRCSYLSALRSNSDGELASRLLR